MTTVKATLRLQLVYVTYSKYNNISKTGITYSNSWRANWGKSIRFWSNIQYKHFPRLHVSDVKICKGCFSFWLCLQHILQDFRPADLGTVPTLKKMLVMTKNLGTRISKQRSSIADVEW